MNLAGINASLLSQLPALDKTGGQATNVGTDGSFGSLVRDALDSLDKSQKGAEQEIGRAVAGESQDLHQTIIALQTADLTFQLGLQVRNKLVGAYEEIMRMQV